MKYFYIATNNFARSGHPAPTLNALCRDSKDPVILFAPPQEESFRSDLPAGCQLVEFLPTREVGRNLSPPHLGTRIAEELLARGIRRDDLVVLRIPPPFLVFAVVHALTRSKVSEVGPRLSVLISQTDEGQSSERIKYSDCFRMIESLPPRFRDRVALLHEREVLLRHWRRQFPLIRMGLCGYVSEWGCQSLPDVADGKPEYSLVYLGEARTEKGFTTLADLAATGEIGCGIMVHCDAYPHNLTDEYGKAMQKLREAAHRMSHIHLIAQKQHDCYGDALHRRAIALMLYSREYRLRGSGVLQECAAAGMFVIAYDDLGFHLDYPQNVLTVPRTSDPRALARAVQACVDQITAGTRELPLPNALSANAFRDLLHKSHLDPFEEQREFPLVIPYDVRVQGRPVATDA